MGPNPLFAMLTQRQMMWTGLRRETTARCAWRSAVGGRESECRLSPALSLRQYLDAPLVAPPLGRLDCVPVVSGACALVLSARPAGVHVTLRARALQRRSTGRRRTRTGIAEFAPAMWAEAGIGPEDMNVVGVYDDYPAMALAQLCDLGFTDAGDLPGFVARLANRSLPVNTAGGQLSAGQAGTAGGMAWRKWPVNCWAGRANARFPARGGRGHRLRHGATALRHVRQCGGTGKGGRMSLHVFACAACGHKVYPARLWCPACGHAAGGTRGGRSGELLAWTSIPDGEGGLRLLATVRALPQGPDLIIRLPPELAESLRAGQRLALSTRRQDGFDAPWGGPA